MDVGKYPTFSVTQVRQHSPLKANKDIRRLQVATVFPDKVNLFKTHN